MRHKPPDTILANIDQFTGRSWLLPALLTWLDGSNARLPHHGRAWHRQKLACRLVGGLRAVASRKRGTVAVGEDPRPGPGDALLPGHRSQRLPAGLRRERGEPVAGASADTPQFTVDVIARWWTTIGQAVYGSVPHLLILADAGGSNGCRPRLWKQQLQEQLCDRLGLAVTVCHYPTGCSKWNPVEHRLFGPISVNWAGQPLRTWDTLVGYIRGTTTTAGLTVEAFRHDGCYETGRSVSQEDMDALNFERHTVCPNWNYTLRPQAQKQTAGTQEREVVS